MSKKFLLSTGLFEDKEKVLEDGTKSDFTYKDKV